MTRTLFNISEDLRTLADLLEEVGGEVTSEEAEAAIDSFFAELGAERNNKIDSYCGLIRELEAKADVRKLEANRLLSLAATDELTARKLKFRLHAFLQLHGEQKIETARFKISRVKNGGKTPVEFSEYFQNNPEELPESLRRVVFTPNSEALRGLLESGEGTEFGQLKERGEHLRIK